MGLRNERGFQECHLALCEGATWAVRAPSSYSIKGLMENSLAKLGVSGDECVVLLCPWTWAPLVHRNGNGFHRVWLSFAASSKPFYDVTCLEIEASRLVARLPSLSKSPPLLIWTPASQLPQRKMTYTSVVMNPVSSDRKRKRMKRQQQMETVGNTDSVSHAGCSTREASPHCSSCYP